MTGSVIGLDQKGLNSGFGLDVMVGVGAPDGVVWASSGTLLVDFVNDELYQNNTAAALGVGSSWTATLK